ncbi:MAG: alpha-mannosidase [Spirochaetota bacterium]
MQNEHIYRRRIRQFIDRVKDLRYGERHALDVTYTYDKKTPIPIAELGSRKWKAITPGSRWGELWGSAWFKVQGAVPQEFAGREVVALVDLGSEGCIFRDGSPWQGLTDVPRTSHFGTGKRRVHLFPKATGGERVDLLIEAGANALFGYHGHQEFVLRQAELAVFDREAWQVWIDLDFLFGLAMTVPERSVRARRLLDGLNRAANAWRDGEGRAEVAAICASLLKPRAGASATTSWSVGHAHLDLGWLWPVRETRRKAGRTFATALRMLEEYPDYVFGASQPQAFAWVKEDYPALYREMKRAIASGRWECQGAMWVEPDMNVTGGESLVRQLLYGKRFFREEFGEEVTNLWLPDVFGYSAALPQILRLAGVDSFMTQKISWNETNSFPHHTFDWEGIDGTRIRTHFLPANTYNASMEPSELVAAEERFAQADVSNDWLNLYGIGDGGGGPGRLHIERALRAANTEGLPRVKLAPAAEFFRAIAKVAKADLPVWRGELYLELHRGTYTTQARIKQLNRALELRLRDAEYLAALTGTDQRAEIEAIWKDLLLNQFHDILPGSSIGLVYKEANAASERHLRRLEELISSSLTALHGTAPGTPDAFAVHNTLSWERHALVELPWRGESVPVVRDVEGRALVAQPVDGGLLVPVAIPSMGMTGLSLESGSGSKERSRQSLDDEPRAAATPLAGRWSREQIIPVRASEQVLENALVRVTLGSDGTIASIRDKEYDREVLEAPANRFLLWEDYPYSWDAWDISHYYRETEPEQAVLHSRRLVESGPLRAVVEQEFRVGSSTILERVVLEAESRLVRLETRVEWHEQHKQLRVQARPAIHALEASYEIQFGAVRRPAHENTSWDQAQFEVAGQRFADYSQVDYGLGLVNDSKYGHYIRDGVMELTLLRSPKDPDPDADQGTHEFTLGYYPHALGWEASDLLERAHELNAPVLLRAIARAAERTSEFSVAGGLVKIETVKPAEDGRGIIMRLYETRGARRTIVLRSKRPFARIEEVDLMEDRRGRAPRARAARADGMAAEIELTFEPFQIRTFRIEFDA